MWQYNYSPYPDELYHYGVPGMRWGQRKLQQYYDRSVASKAVIRRKAKFDKKIDKKIARATKKGADKYTMENLRNKKAAVASSKYGKTRGQIALQGLKKTALRSIAGYGGAALAAKTGHTKTAMALAGATSLANTAGVAKTGYRMATAYGPRKKQRRR